MTETLLCSRDLLTENYFWYIHLDGKRIYQGLEQAQPENATDLRNFDMDTVWCSYWDFNGLWIRCRNPNAADIYLETGDILGHLKYPEFIIKGRFILCLGKVVWHLMRYLVYEIDIC